MANPTPSGTRNPNAPAQSGQDFGVTNQSGGRLGVTRSDQPVAQLPGQAPMQPNTNPFGNAGQGGVPAPNATALLPQWDPHSPDSGAGGLGTAYMNMFRPAGLQPQLQAGNDLLRRNLIGPAAFMQINRQLPGQEQMDASRTMQQGAISGLRGAGANAAAGQAMLPAQARANAQPGLNVTNQLLARGGQVGAGQAQAQDMLSNYLLHQASGNAGPTAAGAMFQQNLDRNIAAQRSMGAGVRGGSAAAASRTGAQAGVQLGLEAQSQASMLRAQEQQSAQQLAAQNLAQSRGQAIQGYGVQAGVASQAQQDAMQRDAMIAQILGQTRGQDITQAGMVADQAGAFRQGDMAGAELGLRGRSLDDQLQQQRIQNAITGQQFLTNFALQDQGMMLDAAGVMGNLQTGQQNVANQRRSLELTERGQNIQLGGAAMGAGGSLVAGLA